jgi:MFS transporter, FSR family, fosmidomycin resistance protein
MDNQPSRNVFSNLLVYGLTHALVDASCIAALFSFLGKTSNDLFFVLVLTYNILAFGLQVLIGLEVDKRRSPRNAALVGCILTAGALLSLGYSPILTVVLAGVGNAFFHIGGGSISLNLTPKKATAPGIYVAPGALGVTIGLLAGTGGLIAWLFILLLAVSCVAIIATKPPMMYYDQHPANSEIKYFELALLLLFLCISIRSLIGLAMVFPWKTDHTLLMLLTLSVVAGKAFGGILADRLGWLRFTVASLVISAPLLAFGAGIPYAAIIGIFLFQMTMPVTLVAISNMFPGRPGFSFGLTCLALIIGALPTFTELKNLFGSEVLILSTILFSAGCLYAGLRLYSAHNR